MSDFRQSMKDSATVGTFHTLDSFEDDGISTEFSSQIFASTSREGSDLRSSAMSLTASTRGSVMRTKSSELKLMGRSSTIQSNSQMLSELTINKFDIKSLGLIGRENEIEALRSCYERMVDEKEDDVPHPEKASTQSLIQSQAHKELVFISGYSGVGKSSLAKTLEKDINATNRGVFVEGKFDLNDTDEPYSGIATAFGEICKKLMKLRESTKVTKRSDPSSFGSRLSAALGSMTTLLTNLIPELDGMLPMARRHSGLSNPDKYDFEVVQKRVKYAFRVLAAELNAEFSPMVMVLDDLQWADVSSLEVIDFLISDMQNPNALMIVGCYRSNEVDEKSMLFNKMQSLVGRKDKFNFHITDIALSSCDVDSVNKMIMGMMSMDEEERTRGLAEICFKRTEGNPFFLIEFMLMLQSEGLISYNLGLLKWVWDDEKIAATTMSADNVVDLLQGRMRKMTDKVQLLLQYAACLGSTFTLSTLEIIWQRHAVMSSEFSSDTVERLLEVVLESNFIEECGDQEFHWVHDKIQEAALFLTAKVTPAFQFEIGTALYHSLDAKEFEDQLFDVVDLINKGQVSKRPELAQLNLRAAEKARNISAFQSASKYATNGIGMLPSNKWDAHRSLTLRLYTLGAEVELALGHVEGAETYSNEVLNRKDCSTMEKLPLKMAQAAKICTVDLKFNETIVICLDILKELGCNLVWTRATVPMQAISALMRTIKMAKKAPAPQVLFERLGTMKDPKHRAIMTLIARLGYACYNAENIFLNVLGVCKTVEMTLKYGVNEYSASGLTGLGMMALAVQQDFETATTFAEMGLALQKAVRTSRESEATYIAHTYALAWTKPIQASMAPFEAGYASGMRTGDTTYGMWNLLAHHVWLPYIMGKRLGPILEQCPKLLTQMEEVSQPEQATVLRMFWQMFVNLTTPSSKHEGKLEGDIFSSEKFVGKGAVYVGTIHLVQGELLVFNDFEGAAKRAMKGGDKFAKLAPGIFFVMIEIFHRAVSLYAMARQTKKRKYKVQANKLARTIEKWMDRGNPNVKYYHLLLSAERAALDKKFDIAEGHYKKAIVLAARTGHMHHAGLCNERYADFLLKQLSNEEEAKYRTKEAIRFYEAWGAVGKVESLQKLL